jgi:hypothetical protein
LGKDGPQGFRGPIPDFEKGMAKTQEPTFRRGVLELRNIARHLFSPLRRRENGAVLRRL